MDEVSFFQPGLGNRSGVRKPNPYDKGTDRYGGPFCVSFIYVPLLLVLDMGVWKDPERGSARQTGKAPPPPVISSLFGMKISLEYFQPEMVDCEITQQVATSFRATHRNPLFMSSSDVTQVSPVFHSPETADRTPPAVE